MKLQLPQVMLCAVTSVNVAATLAALEHTLALADFGDAALFTDAAPVVLPAGLRTVPIARLDSGAAYSRFVLERLADHLTQPWCMLVQWDGFPTHPELWDPAFLAHDYIGAPWPQFDDGMDVGNGGFSLRSRRLMAACREPQFRFGHPEDTAIGRGNRAWLEAQGITFAPRALAARFSRERSGMHGQTFGFHGVFNLAAAIGPAAFRRLYTGLDDRTGVWRDARAIGRDLRAGGQGRADAARFTAGRVLAALRTRRWR